MSKRKTQRGRQRKATQRGKRKKQKGGVAPFFVDFKQGIKVTKDLIRDLKKTRRHEKSRSCGSWLQT